MSYYKMLLERAVETLSEKTPQNRAVVYDGVRESVSKQLELMPEDAAERERQRLEKAILAVEQTYASSQGRPDAPQATPTQPLSYGETASLPDSSPYEGIQKPGFLQRLTARYGSLLPILGGGAALALVLIFFAFFFFKPEPEASDAHVQASPKHTQRLGDQKNVTASSPQSVVSQAAPSPTAQREISKITPSLPQAQTAPTQPSPPVPLAFLYEEKADAQGNDIRHSGTLKWSIEQKENLVNAQPHRYTQALIDIPGRNMQAALRFSLNTDKEFPAKYIIEIEFLSKNGKPFPHPIARVSNLMLKSKENVRGVPLSVASAQVSPTLFWLALPTAQKDNAHNERLLRTQPWIDMPIIFADNKRALLTFRKPPDILGPLLPAAQSRVQKQ